MIAARVDLSRMFGQACVHHDMWGGMIGDLFSFAGLVLTMIGAWRTANAVILREDDAIRIGLPRFASEERSENLKMPMVQNLLASSRGARVGLLFIVTGTLLQAVPLAYRLLQAFIG